MKKVLLSLFTMLVIVSSTFAVNSGNWKMKVQEEVGDLDPAMTQMKLDEFLTMTPAKYRKTTGKRLGIMNTIKMKAAQRFLKKNMKKNLNSEEGNVAIPQVAYIIMTIFLLGWLAMGLMDNWKGNNWWINLILTITVIGSIIHGLLVMNQYY